MLPYCYIYISCLLFYINGSMDTLYYSKITILHQLLFNIGLVTLRWLPRFKSILNDSQIDHTGNGADKKLWQCVEAIIVDFVAIYNMSRRQVQCSNSETKFEEQQGIESHHERKGRPFSLRVMVEKVDIHQYHADDGADEKDVISSIL